MLSLFILPLPWSLINSYFPLAYCNKENHVFCIAQMPDDGKISDPASSYLTLPQCNSVVAGSIGNVLNCFWPC